MQLYGKLGPRKLLTDLTSNINFPIVLTNWRPSKWLHSLGLMLYVATFLEQASHWSLLVFLLPCVEIALVTWWDQGSVTSRSSHHAGFCQFTWKTKDFLSGQCFQLHGIMDILQGICTWPDLLWFRKTPGHQHWHIWIDRYGVGWHDLRTQVLRILQNVHSLPELSIMWTFIYLVNLIYWSILCLP